MTTRDRIHARHCRDPLCDAAGDAEPGDDCKNLDYLLNQVEDDRVHAEVHRILDISMMTMLLHGAQVNQGLGLAIKTVDPYVLHDGILTRKSDGRVMTCDKCPIK